MEKIIFGFVLFAFIFGTVGSSIFMLRRHEKYEKMIECMNIVAKKEHKTPEEIEFLAEYDKMRQREKEKAKKEIDDKINPNKLREYIKEMNKK